MIPRPHPAVIFKPVTEGAVLLHADTEIYFGLNHVGARVWELLNAPSTDYETIVASLSETYTDVDLQVLRDDVAALVAQLTENGLLVEDHGSDASSQNSP